mgnify:CR=1 FL=1
MKILLINSPTPNSAIVRNMAGGLGFDGSSGIILPPLELMYYAAVLIQQGHTVRLIDAGVEDYSTPGIITFTKEFQPDFVIATA